jgi:uncharacterized protein DUF4962/heparinase II/III-like protein
VVRRRTLLQSLILPCAARLDAAAIPRPRLFLSAARVDDLKRRTKTSHREIWQIVAENADALLGKMPPSDFNNESQMRSAGRGIPWQALAFLITGEQRYFAGARTWMLRVCAYPHWEDDRSLAGGECLFGVAVGYDWLHAHLSERDRKLIREKLVHQADAMHNGPPVQHEIWLANHNHVEHLGLAAAGFALEGEVPQAARWVDAADRVFRQALEFSSRDGSSTEGHQYWAYSAESILRYCELARDLRHQDLYRSEWLKNIPDFIIHSTLPDFSAENCVMSFGDSHRTYELHGPTHILYRVAAEYRNPYAQWLALEMQRRGVGRRGYCGWAGLLWYDETLAPKPVAQLPTFWNCDDIGWVTSRSSWEPDAVMIGFKCGPMHGRKAQQYYVANPERHEIGGGHGHADVNSFQIYARGQWLAIDPGYERPKWTRTHNTVLVNGHGQLGEGQTWFDRKAVLEAKASSDLVQVEHHADYDYLVGDAMTIYPRAAGLRKFQRHFLFLKPDVVLIVDDLAADPPGRYEWLLHTGKGLDVRFLSPRNMRTIVEGTTLTATPEPAGECVLVAALLAGEPAEVHLLEVGQALSPADSAGGPKRLPHQNNVSLAVRNRRVEFALAERRVTIGLL